MNKELIEELKAQDFNVVAVSKTRTKEEIDEVAKMGLTTFGENRVQEFIDKYDPKYTWHIIGHLQTNKVKYIIGKVDVIEIKRVILLKMPKTLFLNCKNLNIFKLKELCVLLQKQTIKR